MKLTFIYPKSELRQIKCSYPSEYAGKRQQRQRCCGGARRDCLRCRCQCGSGGAYVIKNQQMLPFEFLGMAHSEDTADVAASLFRRERGLCAVRPYGCKAGDHRQTGGAVDPDRNFFRLVVSPHRFFPEMHRYGNHGVNAVEEACREKFRARTFSEPAGQIPESSVFKIVNQLRHIVSP